MHLRRLTFDPSLDQFPVWTPDGQRIVFASLRGGAFSSLFAQAADGTGTVERLTTGADTQSPAFVAPDGTAIVGAEISPKTAGDIVRFPLKGSAGSGPSVVEPLVRTPAIEYLPELSPDGRYIAYQSDKSARDEIYVRPFPHVNDGEWQVSTAGGTSPMWARTGRELFYLGADGALMAVPVQTSGGTFTFRNPAKLFATAYAAPVRYARSYDVSPDAQRFLMIKENVVGDLNARRTSMVVVLNWSEELKRLVPTR